MIKEWLINSRQDEGPHFIVSTERSPFREPSRTISLRTTSGQYCSQSAFDSVTCLMNIAENGPLLMSYVTADHEIKTEAGLPFLHSPTSRSIS